MARQCVVLFLTLLVTGYVTVTAQSRSSAPRIEPVDALELTTDVRAGIESFGGDAESATNLQLTLARHPPALHGLGPLSNYLRRQSMVTVVDQLLMGLRVAWLCQSEAMWAELAFEARAVGLGDREIRQVAGGPDAGWGDWDGTVLRAADEIYRDSFLSDDSWQRMAARYDAQQLLDVIFSGAEFIMLSMMANSFGVQPDDRFPDRFPADVEYQPLLARPAQTRLTEARLEPIGREDWSAEVRQLLDPAGTGSAVLNLYATLARHPTFFRPRAVQSAYIRTGATLSDRAREILILRIGWLCGSEYEWSQHVRVARGIGMSADEIRDIAVGATASRWNPFEADLLKATDELHQQDAVSDATWSALSSRYGTGQLIDMVITVAGYRMVSIALNSLGTQLEPGRPRFPDVDR